MKNKTPQGRPEGIPNPDGPERIRRKKTVIWDTVLKRAIGGDAGNARIALEAIGEIPHGTTEIIVVTTEGETVDLQNLPLKLKDKIKAFHSKVAVAV